MARKKIGRVALSPSWGYTVDLKDEKQVHLAMELLIQDVQEAVYRGDAALLFDINPDRKLSEEDISPVIREVCCKEEFE